jgi:hypothetical protein
MRPAKAHDHRSSSRPIFAADHARWRGGAVSIPQEGREIATAPVSSHVSAPSFVGLLPIVVVALLPI